MRFGSILFALFAALAATIGLAQDRLRLQQFAAEEKHYYALSTRAIQIAPRRRDAPMRAVNVTDEEVREIQAAAREIVPRSIINIGAVTTGCPCEDGPRCTDQVWIVATSSSRTTGLLLSRILDSWVVGPVQTWWLRYGELLKQEGSYKDFRKFDAAQRRLLDEMPFCATSTADVDLPQPVKASAR